MKPTDNAQVNRANFLLRRPNLGTPSHVGLRRPSHNKRAPLPPLPPLPLAALPPCDGSDACPVPDQKIAAWPGHTTSTIKNDGRAARQKSILADNDGSIVTSFLFIVSPPVSVDCPLHDHRLRFVRFHANANRKCKFQTQQLGYVPIGFCYNYLCTHLRYVRVCVAL